MNIANTQFVVVSKWGKQHKGRPVRGVLCSRLLGIRQHPMEKIWEYLHRIGCHGIMHPGARIAERQLRRRKRKVIYGGY